MPIFGASASIPAVKYDGNILRGVSNKPLNVTMSGEGAFPKKLLTSGQNPREDAHFRLQNR